MPDPVETAELLAFVKTVEARSVSRAALELGLPRATIGRRLARLEERLGVRLLQRSTRTLSLTDAGKIFHGSARLALDAVEQADDSVRREEGVVRGPLRVSLPPMTDEALLGVLCEFAKRYPAVDLQLHFSTEFVDLRGGGFHLALRAGGALEPGLVARTLVRVPILAVAAPEYLRAHGTPKSARDLRHHRCLLGFTRGVVPESHWPLLRGGKLHVEGSFVSNSLPMLVRAALVGLGITLVPLPLVAGALEQGRLVHVLPTVVGGEARLSVVYAERELTPPQVRAFIDFLVEWAPEFLPRQTVELGTSPARSPSGERPARAPKRRRARAARRKPV
ncbi:MAG TPA: LysR family transcriptional regulator [Polyangiaceae bacterium]|nr:LysR family transcriptional regulator [Polyangiaceae bacterium]